MNDMFAEVKVEFEKVYGNDQKMIDFCMKEISGIVKLEDNGYYCFEKPSIRTRFCFGYGQNGISTKDDYDAAVNAKNNITMKDAFFAANMETFNNLEKILEYPGELYSTCRYNNENVLLRSLASQEEEYRWGRIYGTIISKLTPVDRLNIKVELTNQKKKFMKRLETYWKRYGNSKLKTWTYLVD